jgi:hypothetical protein
MLGVDAELLAAQVVNIEAAGIAVSLDVGDPMGASHATVQPHAAIAIRRP